MNILQERDFITAELSWSALQAGRRRARLVCLVASVIPVLMICTVVVLRGGFVTPVSALVRIAGISLLIVNAAAFGSRKRWMLCGPLLSLYALVCVTAIGLSPVGGSATIGTLIACAGAGACTWNAVAVVARAGLLRSAALLIVGLFLGLYAESMYWRVYSVHDVVYPEAIVAGRVATDVAEQAAIVNMISTHHLASTAIDGLLPLKYHNGSLWIAEGLRRLCGFRAIDFLGYGYGILLIPLYVLAFLGCAELLRSAVWRESDTPPFIFWAGSVVAFVGVFPFTEDPLHLNFNEIVINSDSFLLGVTLSLLLVGAGVWFYEVLRERDFVWPLQEKIALIVILSGTLVLVGWVKISQIYLLLALLSWLLVRVKWMRTWPFLLVAVVSTLALAGMLVGERGANLSRFAPLNFDRISPEWVPYFFVFYFAWVWLLLAVWARFRGVRAVGELRQMAKAGNTILIELVLATVFAGVIPYLLVDFYSPAWKYFTVFQGVVAGVFVVAFLPQFRWADLLQRARDGSLRVAQTLILGFMLAVCGHLFMTTVASAYRMLKKGCETRAVLAGMPDSAWRQQLGQIKHRRSLIAPALAARVQLVQCLTRLGDQPVGQRRGTALYIPKTNRTYWDMRQLGDGTTPFIAPALASIPMVEGLPEYSDIGWARVGWGYPQYKLPSGPEAPTENLERVLDKARTDGFRELLVLRDGSAGECGIQEIPLS